MRKALPIVVLLVLAIPQPSGAAALLFFYGNDCRMQASSFLVECEGWGIAALDELTGQRLADVVAPQSGEYEGGYFALDDRCDVVAADQRFQGETGDYVGLFRPYGKDRVDSAWFYQWMAARPGEILLDDFTLLRVFDQHSGALVQTVDKLALGLPTIGPSDFFSGVQLLDGKLYFSSSSGATAGYSVRRTDAATRAVDPQFQIRRALSGSQPQFLLLLQLGTNAAGELVAWERLSGLGGSSDQLSRFDARSGQFLGLAAAGIAPLSPSGSVTFFDGLFYDSTPASAQSSSGKIRRYSPDTGFEVLPAWDFPGAGELSAPLVRRTCTPDNRSLRLRGERFEVQASYRTPAGQTGDARAAGPRSDQGGQLWFFEKTNPELVVKILDGCAINGNYWVYLAGLTDLAVDVTVRDTSSGNVRTYSNAQGQPFAPVQDTAAFASCP